MQYLSITRQVIILQFQIILLEEVLPVVEVHRGQKQMHIQISFLVFILMLVQEPRVMFKEILSKISTIQMLQMLIGLEFM